MKDLLLRENITEILDYIEEGLHVIDRNGIIVFQNKFGAALDGVDRSKSIGRHLFEVYPSLDADSSTLLTVMKTGEKIYRKEQSFFNYFGQCITTVNTSIPIRSRGAIVGAIEFSKDITDVKELSETIVDLKEKLYKQKDKGERIQSEARYTLLDIIGESPKIRELKEKVLKAGESEVSVLVSGETGTGKELFVHAVHNASRRRNKPFIVQNCAALPANLLEGILFGTEKGGFTGAENRAGLFEISHGGTLFLDEINSMPPELQAKLLRVLQDGHLRRVGSTKIVKVDVRIIAAINVSPEEALEKKQLRKDLFYRLHVLHFPIPPLRERREDIPVLTDFFVGLFNQKYGKRVKGVSDEVRRLFFRHAWEGNVRELEHLLEAAISMTDKEVLGPEDLPAFRAENDRMEEEPEGLKERLALAERRWILEALLLHGGNISKTAEVLKIPRQTLQYKLEKYGIGECRKSGGF